MPRQFVQVVHRIQRNNKSNEKVGNTMCCGRNRDDRDRRDRDRRDRDDRVAGDRDFCRRVNRCLEDLLAGAEDNRDRDRDRHRRNRCRWL
jgi:hypothetical protein